ncbi:Co2+/Mg2+ efflux protein ApaG [Marixanthomonas spongiae]|uniref:Co2+/Mg2+ efflux protein ApaG n=1 Tax=Marixanthomonas spongiae TaxID=2174845 RepID=A0A2U0I7G9_9FLAO|nr:Co2+/Mg2+ efflux protein ApaG [Marixanthomonas spongiae]PVW17042.1 Co2+/Mg2+ efflux protein ApaG [Marixanthomonas spongiae]
MVQQITKGIKISVIPRFEGTLINKQRECHAFSYTITIENQSKVPVQLLSRHWIIKDSLKPIEIVEGDGVIGVRPLLPPGEKHAYSSGCLLQSPFGSMEGHYIFRNPNTYEKFKIPIPLFKLHAAFALN